MNTLPLSDFASLPASVDVAVIGSGPGGAVTACTLAEGGRETVVLEEGGLYPQQQYPPFGRQEMLAACRRGGMTLSWGRCPVNYVEARCVGGGSEINSGLYHRPPDSVLARWARAGVEGADSGEIADICAENEKDIGIVAMPGDAQPASQKLARGAAALNLCASEIPRWHQYDDDFTPQRPGGIRQSMSRTMLPRFVAAGGRLAAHCKVRRLRRDGNEWTIEAAVNSEPVRLRAKTVFVAAGAVHTPRLLRASGHRRGIGDTLRMHLFTRVIAEFDDVVNGAGAGIGPHQVTLDTSAIRFGCGVSTPAHLAAAFAQCGSDEWLLQHDTKWRHRAAYYAAIGGGAGKVRGALDDEVVFYRPDSGDYYTLADGTRTLCEMLFRAGATRVLPIFKGSVSLLSEDDLWKLPRPLAPSRACLSSVHLMGSCPMGSDGACSAYGAVRGADNLHVADASLFCDSPDVNPQGTVMAFARRNARHFLSTT